jgi:hypothetical protein
MLIENIPDSLPPELPSDVASALGSIQARQTYLALNVKLIVAMLSDFSVQMALRGLADDPFRETRARVRRLAKWRFGPDHPATIKLLGYMHDCDMLEKQHDEVARLVWVKSASDDWRGLYMAGIQAAPEAHGLNQLARDIFNLSALLHEARTSGFLRDELNSAPKPKW